MEMKFKEWFESEFDRDLNENIGQLDQLGKKFWGGLVNAIKGSVAGMFGKPNQPDAANASTGKTEVPAQQNKPKPEPTPQEKQAQNKKDQDGLIKNLMGQLTPYLNAFTQGNKPAPVKPPAAPAASTK
jgi:hypothetical protein